MQCWEYTNWLATSHPARVWPSSRNSGSSRRFGLRHYGRIYAWQLSAFLLAAGVAPVLMGAARDRFGSYETALTIDAVVILLGALAIGSLRRGGQPAVRAASA